MGEQAEEEAAASSVEQRLILCQECKKNPFKYKCPACSVRSCSLSCVNSHKQRSGCNGKRNQTEFVHLSQFNDNILLSDFHLLEEVKRVTESAQRTRAQLCGFSNFKLPYPLRSLRSAAASRRTKLLFLPSGMSKRARNQSRYDTRKKFISWTIEWRFHSTDVVLRDHGIREDTLLSTALEKHMQPSPWKHQLRQFCDARLDHLKLFIRKYPKGPKSPFKELEIKSPIKQQLANLVILEYPVIHVFLPSQSYDFEVFKDACPVNPRSDAKFSAGDDHSNVNGVCFREEEIEDDNHPESRVDDLIQSVDPTSRSQLFHPEANSDKVSGGPSAEPGPVVNNQQPSSSVGESSFIEDVEFDFDQGLIDAYSDLIAQMNPDDFLDLDGEFAGRIEERRGLVGECNLSPVENELEEGEIAE